MNRKMFVVLVAFTLSVTACRWGYIPGSDEGPRTVTTIATVTPIPTATPTELPFNKVLEIPINGSYDSIENFDGDCGKVIDWYQQVRYYFAYGSTLVVSAQGINLVQVVQPGIDQKFYNRGVEISTTTLDGLKGPTLHLINCNQVLGVLP